MRNGAAALVSFVALALVGVNVTRPDPPGSVTNSVAAATTSSGVGRRAEPLAESTRPRALRLLADHWGIALRPVSTSTVETRHERRAPQPKAGEKTTVTETESRTKEAAREIDARDAAVVERRFKESGGRVLIATMPDPLDSDLAMDFDRYLEAIERSAAARGFVPDRHDLPWQQPAEGDAAATGSEAGRHRSEPGLFLFRELGPADSERILLLAVVGETPIRGIQKLAFTNALLLARRLNGEDAELRIVGPALSGSIPSIRLVLEQVLTAAGGKPTVTFIATTATRDQNRADLERNDAAMTVHYRAAVHPNTVSFEALEAFLADRGYPGLSADAKGERRLAIVSESSSAYGSVAHGSHDRSSEASCRPQPVQRTVQPSSASPPLPFGYECFSFPMQIAQLRAAYEREQLTGRRGPKDAAPPTALQLSYGSGSTDRERTPVYATSLSANAAERVLLNTFDAIARQRIRYLIIIATDVRDRLFIVQLARRWLPDVQLVSFDTDVLLTHPDLAVEAEGLLTVTSYPLALGATRSSDHAYRQFPSPGAASYFNATTELLRRLVEPPQPDAPTPAKPSSFIGLDAAPGGAALQPRVWVSVINHMQEWPLASYVPSAGVAAFAAVDGHAAAEARPVAATTERFMASAGQKGHILFVGIITLLALVCMLVLASFPNRVPAPHRIQQDLLTVFRTAPAWLLLLLASVLALTTWRTEPTTVWAAAAGMTCCIGSAIAWRPGPMHDVLTQRALHTTLAGFVVVGVIAIVWPHVAQAREVPIEELRRFVLGSGIEPRVPLALVVGAIVVLVLVQPLQGTDQRHFDALNPFPASAAGRGRQATSGFHEFHGLIAQELFWQVRGRSVIFALLAAGAVLAGILLGAPFAHLRGLDGRWYDTATSLLLTIGLFFVVASSLQAWCIWRRVRTLLRRLAWHPMHAAFDRLPERLAHDLGLKGSLRFAPVSALGFSIEQAGFAANHLDAMRPASVPTGAIARALAPVSALRQQAITRGWAYKFRREIRQAASARRSQRAVDSATIIRLLDVSRCLSGFLFQVWDARPLPTGLLGTTNHPFPKGPTGPDGREEHTVHIYRTHVPDAFHVFVRLCEDVVAAMTVVYLRFLFVLLKRLLLGVVGATTLLLLATVSYPFGPRGSLTVGALVLFAGLIGLVVALIIATERDPILSRLANTVPNKLTFSTQLVTQFGLYVCAPAAIAITTQFPRLRDVVGRFVDPLLKVIQG